MKQMEQKEDAFTANGKTKRLANFELLRCVAMMMVVVLHFLGKSGILVPLSAASMAGYEYAAYGIESLCIVAVNVYMLISGYFLAESHISWKRVIRLWLQVWVYSVGIGAAAYLAGWRPDGGFTLYDLARLVFPISKNHYWFMTAYIYMMLFAPLLSAGVKKLTKKQLEGTIAALLTAFSLIKSILPMRLETDNQGYDVVWYLCVFLLAAYFRLYGLKFLKNKKRGLLVYFLSAAAIFAESFGLRMVYLKCGKLSDILSVCCNYNHIFVLTASVGLFAVFYHMTLREGTFSRLVCRIAPYTLGVYLLHCHTALDERWQQWIFLLTGRPENIGSLLAGIVLSVILVFTAGILLDRGRAWLFRWIEKFFFRKSVDKA